MGNDIILCNIGYPTRNSPLGRKLEGQAWELKKHFKAGFLRLHEGIEQFHHAVDRIVDDADEGAAQVEIDRGVEHLEGFSRHVEALVQAVLGWERALGEHASVDPEEPLVLREKYLSTLPYDSLRDEWIRAGALLPVAGVWEEVSGRLREGGTPAGLRPMIRTLRRLQGQVRTYLATIARYRRLEGEAMAEALHGMSLEGAALHTSWTVFMAQATTVALLTERATLRWHDDRIATA